MIAIIKGECVLSTTLLELVREVNLQRRLEVGAATESIRYGGPCLSGALSPYTS
jgi:hypothetical protein